MTFAVQQIHAALRPGSTFLIAEPKGHVSEEQFGETLDAAKKAGLEIADRPTAMGRSRTALLKK